jgi:acetyl-CoA acetyltransferase
VKKQQITVSDLKLIEINEAFAAVGVASARALAWVRTRPTKK